MSWEMDAGQQDQEGLKEKNFRKQLAAAVRSTQWSYGILWSPSSRKEGVLEWSDGFYNGDIKTRKTTQPMEFKADQLGLQRSDQLRELYESLSAGDSIPHTRRPSASLSPEDLTDTEWYYLVCMSFTFTPGQGLVGKVFASNQHIWLSNAQIIDSKIFSRSLLAKSASIQTVVCFPFMGGVLELGCMESVAEDAALIQHVTSSFWELSFPVSSEQSISSRTVAERDDNLIDTNFDQEVVNAIDVHNHDLVPESDLSIHFPFDSRAAPNDEMETRVCSPNDSFNEYFPNQHADDSFRMEQVNVITSQVQSRHLIDDEFCDVLPVSLDLTDCISQSFVNPRRILSSLKGERLKNQVLDCLREGDNINLSSLDFGADDAHYLKTIAAILKNSKQLTVMPHFRNNFHESSFTIWRKGSSVQLPPTSSCQNMLKKVVVDVSWKNGAAPQKPQEDNGLKSRPWRTEGDDAGANHMLSERRRREKLNEKFLILRSLVPSISKVDKASILGDTIEYLKELERRVEELESCRELMDVETRERRKHPDVIERTSDNYADPVKSNCRQTSRNKRKACSIDEAEPRRHGVLSKDGPVDVNVTTMEKDVTIEMHCPWRDCLLIDIIDAISNLHLDALSVQSAKADDDLALTVKAKFRGSVVASPGMIRKTLHRVIIGKC